MRVFLFEIRIPTHSVYFNVFIERTRRGTRTNIHVRTIVRRADHQIFLLIGRHYENVTHTRAKQNKNNGIKRFITKTVIFTLEKYGNKQRLDVE